jgi:hypothetical protein
MAMSKFLETLAETMAGWGVNNCDVQDSIVSSNPPLNTQRHVPRVGTYY